MPAEILQKRKLTTGEINIVESIFGDDITIEKVMIILTDDRHPNGGAAWVGAENGPDSSTIFYSTNNNYYDINLIYSTDISHLGLTARVVFVHEMAHVWQHQPQSPEIGNRTRDTPNSRNQRSDYNYSDRLSANGIWEPFDTWDREEQANLFADIYRLKNNSPSGRILKIDGVRRKLQPDIPGDILLLYNAIGTLSPDP